MADLNVYITTFNCGRNFINVDYFAASLFHGLKTDLPPDLIVLTLQEIAPLGYSFLGGSLLAPYFAHFTRAVFDGVARRFGNETVYSNVIFRNVGMTGIMVFSRQDSGDKVRWIETAGVGAGLWEMGNKGAVGVRVGIAGTGENDVTSLTFVSAHLAAMEDQWDRRNEDWQTICRGLVFSQENTPQQVVAAKVGDVSMHENEPLLGQSTHNSELNTEHRSGTQGSSLFSPSTHIFFSGDLNYRASDTSPEPNAHLNWPQPSASLSSPTHFTAFFPKDQLTRERTSNRTLHHLTESPVTFPPTYKYSAKAQLLALKRALQFSPRTLSDGRQTTNATLNLDAAFSEEGEWLWAKHRTPSWTDRVLYRETAPRPPTVHGYTALAIQPTSDHRPVAMSVIIPRGKVDASIEIPFAVREDWSKRREAARRYEMVVGLAAYLTFTWEGEALLVGTVVGIVGGYLALRALLATTA